MGANPPWVIRGAWVFLAPARPAFVLPLRFRLAASPFAVVFLLVLANPFYVALSPDASVHATVADSTRFRNSSVKEPTLQRHFVNSKHPSYLRRRKVLHYAT